MLLCYIHSHCSRIIITLFNWFSHFLSVCVFELYWNIPLSIILQFKKEKTNFGYYANTVYSHTIFKPATKSLQTSKPGERKSIESVLDTIKLCKISILFFVFINKFIGNAMCKEDAFRHRTHTNKQEYPGHIDNANRKDSKWEGVRMFVFYDREIVCMEINFEHTNNSDGIKLRKERIFAM